MRAFITGGSGFIGTALAHRLRARGWSTSGVDLVAEESLNVVAGDIAEAGAWRQHARGADVVLHTAAIVSNAVDAATMWRVNVRGTQQVARAARDAGVPRLVHFSSVRAFSDAAFPDGVAEDWPVRPDGNPYVDTKIASEQVVLQAHAADEVAVTVIRPGDVYGPGSVPWTILPVRAIRSGLFALPALGRGVFSPVYVDNLLDGVELAAGSDAAVGQVLTLSDGVAVTTSEFFGHYCRMLGRRRPLALPTPVALAAAGALSWGSRARGRPTESGPATVRYLARTGTYSIDKARRMLGYTPEVGLAEGMERTERWLETAGLLR